jgi:hypothetical protein
MKPAFLLAAAVTLTPLFAAEDYGRLIFQDDFARTESQEQKDEPGNGWATNSQSRAKGNKQVDLRDGALFISTHAEANHAASATHPLEFTDGVLALRFMLPEANDSLGVNFADPQCKEVHAGHLFAIKVSAKQVLLQDLKTGNMRLDIRQAREAKKPLTDEQQQALQGKQKVIPYAVEPGKWHNLLAKIAGNELSVTIDGRLVGSFQSPGIGHPTKRVLRLPTPRNVAVDDLKAWRKE